MNDTDPLRILAIGDYTTKTGLGTALNIPLRKLTERGLVAPIVLGTGFNGWLPFLDGDYSRFPVLPMINPHGAKPDIFGRDCLHLALTEYQRAFGAYIDVVLVCQDIQNQAYIAEPDKAHSRGEITRHAASILARGKRTLVIFAQTRKKYNRAYQDYSSIDFRSVNSPNPHYTSSLHNSSMRDTCHTSNVC